MKKLFVRNHPEKQKKTGSKLTLRTWSESFANIFDACLKEKEKILNPVEKKLG